MVAGAQWLRAAMEVGGGKMEVGGILFYPILLYSTIATLLRSTSVNRKLPLTVHFH